MEVKRKCRKAGDYMIVLEELSLFEMLDQIYSLEGIHKLADVRDISYDEDDTKKKIIKDIVDCLLDEDYFREHLYVISDQHMKIIRKLLKHQDRFILSNRSKENEAFIELDALDYVDIDEEREEVFIPMDVRNLILKIDNHEFEKTRRKVFWLHAVLYHAFFLYGLVSIDEVCTMYNSRAGFNASREDIEYYFSLILLDFQKFVYMDHNFIAFDLLKKDSLESTKELQQYYEIKYPRTDQILDHYNEGYPISSISYNRIDQFIRTKSLSEYKEKKFMRKLYENIIQGEKLAKLLDYFDGYLKDEDEVLFITRNLKEAIKETPQYKYHGRNEYEI